jgi:hypothetical protein
MLRRRSADRSHENLGMDSMLSISRSDLDKRDLSYAKFLHFCVFASARSCGERR